MAHHADPRDRLHHRLHRPRQRKLRQAPDAGRSQVQRQRLWSRRRHLLPRLLRLRSPQQHHAAQGRSASLDLPRHRHLGHRLGTNGAGAHTHAVLHRTPAAGSCGSRLLPRHDPLPHLLVPSPSPSRNDCPADGRKPRLRNHPRAILLRALFYLFLNNRVVEAKWLSERERAAVASEIHEEAVSKTHVSIRSVFTSPRVWLFGAIFFGMEMGSYAIGFWQPTIIRQTGVKDAFHIGMLTTLPYTCALICMMFVGRHSDRTRERRWHIIVPNILAAIGFILCTQSGSNTPIALFGLVLAVAGVITGLAMFWALPTSFLG